LAQALLDPAIRYKPKRGSKREDQVSDPGAHEGETNPRQVDDERDLSLEVRADHLGE